MKCQPITIAGTCEVLVVDADPGFQTLVRNAAPSAGRVRAAASVDQAQSEMTLQPADVLLVNLQINDNAGLRLIKSMRARYPRTEIIAVSRVKRSEICLDAWRAGAADMLLAPIHPDDLRRSIAHVLQRRRGAEQLTQRNLRLRSVCKQLSKARHEIRQQVDLLCNDLVRAYQEMAQQLNLTQLTVDYCQMVANEIEVEGLLRKTMEWVLAKIGPINAAVYLADVDRRFALGAYLNLDTQADAPLINAMSETIVQHSATSSHTLALETDRQIEELFGAPGARLKGRNWLSAACHAPGPKRDCLAVLVVFRQQGDPLDPMRNMLEAVAPILGERIEQALELYHRLHPDEAREDNADDEFGN